MTVRHTEMARTYTQTYKHHSAIHHWCMCVWIWTKYMALQHIYKHICHLHNLSHNAIVYKYMYIFTTHPCRLIHANIHYLTRSAIFLLSNTRAKSLKASSMFCPVHALTSQYNRLLLRANVSASWVLTARASFRSFLLPSNSMGASSCICSDCIMSCHVMSCQQGTQQWHSYWQY